MKPLDGHRVTVVGEAVESPLTRFLASLGASVGLSTAERLAADLEASSFLVDRWSPGEWERSPVPRSAIEGRHARLIHISVTPFGRSSPRTRWAANELIVSAMGGALVLTGDPDRAPVKEALDACLFHTDMVAASAALAAHYERHDSGKGQHIDISAQEVTFSRAINPILVWQFDRRKLRRVGGALGYGKVVVRCIWRLKDGWCFHTLMTGRLGAPANKALSNWMDERGIDNPMRNTDWLRYDRSALEASTRRLWEGAMAAFFLTCTKQEIATEGRARGINATAVCEPTDALSDPHLQARDFWARQDGMKRPGRFFAIQEGPARPLPATKASGPRGPLSGVRVLDFSWALVGSISTKILGDLGADVVKVESRTRPCLSRIDRQVAVSQRGNLDDKPWFAHLNTSKRSLALDLKARESREIVDPLVRWADVVVENFSPGTMEKLGLDYAALMRMKPEIIMVSGSVYGQSGPLAREWGVDGTGAALSGRTYLTGWPDRDPVIPAALPYGDVIVPYVMAAATVAALQNRRETGRGAHIDAAMYEVCLQQTYEALCRTQTGSAPQRTGNADPRRFHQAVYPSKGEDRWIAISCSERTAWSHLCRLAGIEPGEPQACDSSIAAWTATQAAAELAERLQREGIEAGAVQDIEDLMEHDQGLIARAPLAVLDHPLLGPFGHLRTPMRFSRSESHPFRAPGIGEHSHTVAIELAGLTPERVAELESLGVFQ